ncbi:MAG: 50S ribosomal protein L25/general stress protein Ctc [Bacteroidales bacterium]|nr:50S ribosomal protein L25/general stress protein Ctc [Bacteroidales bacterium]
MKEISIKATKREDLGKRGTKAVRNADAVPGILYGSAKDANGATQTIPFTVTNSELRNLIYTPNIYLINLDIDGKQVKAVLKDIQFHPVKDTVLHVDFYQVVEDEPIVMAVPVATSGLAAGVREGGKLNQQVRRLKVRATYDNIPEKLVVDVTKLGLEQTIKVGELSFEGLELVTPKEVVVVAVKMTRAAKNARLAAMKAGN